MYSLIYFIGGIVIATIAFTLFDSRNAKRLKHRSQELRTQIRQNFEQDLKLAETLIDKRQLEDKYKTLLNDVGNTKEQLNTLTGLNDTLLSEVIELRAWKENKLRQKRESKQRANDRKKGA